MNLPRPLLVLPLVAACGSGDLSPADSPPDGGFSDPRADAATPSGDADAADVAELGNPFFAISLDHAPWGPEQARLLRALGAGMVRLEICHWPESRDELDRIVNEARAAGLRVYAELDACTLQSDYPDTRSWHQDMVDTGNQFNWDYAAAAGEIAAHFAGRIDYYEIWNEPNAAPRPIGFDGAGVYWPTPESADWEGACGAYDYGTPYVPLSRSWGICPRQLGVLTTNAYMAIKDSDPEAQVVAGNLLFHGDDAWVAKEYWRQVESSPAVSWFRANRGDGKPPWDLIGIHPYAYPPADGPLSLSAQLDEFAALVASHGDPARLALSEYGWHTGDGDPYLGTDAATQAAYVEATYALARTRDIAFVVWFNYLDAPRGAVTFGLRQVADDGTPAAWKPAARAYCRAAGATECPAP